MKLCEKLLLFIISVYTLMATSCKKDKSELVISNGQTFGCRVNHKPFIADRRDYGYSISPIDVSIWYSPVGRYHYLRVGGDKENERVEIFIDSPLIKGRRELKSKDYGYYRIEYPNKRFITNDVLGGFVDLLVVDTINQKLEGKFEFTATDKTSGEKVVVTNGYFKNF